LDRERRSTTWREALSTWWRTAHFPGLPLHWEELSTTRALSANPVLASRNSESFRGCNDLHLASNGDIYFTDQGQTGLHDPTGRVYRLTRDGRLDCLIDTGISPNGLVLDPNEAVLFVAMTRDNAVWRMPLMKDGSVSKVGRFCSMFGPSGPDGMTMDGQGRLLVPQVLRESAHIRGEVAVLGHLTYLEVRNMEALRKEIEEQAFTDEDIKTLDELGI